MRRSLQLLTMLLTVIVSTSLLGILILLSLLKLCIQKSVITLVDHHLLKTFTLLIYGIFWIKIKNLFLAFIGTAEIRLDCIFLENKVCILCGNLHKCDAFAYCWSYPSLNWRQSGFVIGRISLFWKMNTELLNIEKYEVMIKNFLNLRFPNNQILGIGFHVRTDLQSLLKTCTHEHKMFIEYNKKGGFKILLYLIWNVSMLIKVFSKKTQERTLIFIRNKLFKECKMLEEKKSPQKKTSVSSLNLDRIYQDENSFPFNNSTNGKEIKSKFLDYFKSNAKTKPVANFGDFSETCGSLDFLKSSACMTAYWTRN